MECSFACHAKQASTISIRSAPNASSDSRYGCSGSFHGSPPAVNSSIRPHITADMRRNASTCPRRRHRSDWRCLTISTWCRRVYRGCGGACRESTRWTGGVTCAPTWKAVYLTRRHTRASACCPDIGMWLDEFRQLEAKTLNIIDVPENMRIIGRCLNSLCGVELKAPIGATEATCRMCGSTWQVKDVRLALLRSFIDSGKAFPAGECASLLRECGLAANGNTIRSWHRRKLLEPAGTVGNKPVYRLRDVRQLLVRHAE